MRLYTFINFYLSQIQQGIQTAHIVHELFNKYRCWSGVPSDAGKQLIDWSGNHKTIIVCNAGADPQVQELMDMFAQYEFPYEQFVEDEGLCKARTGCGIVLPDWIYACERKFKQSEDGRFKTPYYEYFVEAEDYTIAHRTFEPGDKYYALIDLIKSKRLA